MFFTLALLRLLLDFSFLLLFASNWVFGLGGLAACFVSIIAIIVIISSFTIRKMDRYERRGNGGQTYSKVPKRLSLAAQEFGSASRVVL